MARRERLTNENSRLRQEIRALRAALTDISRDKPDFDVHIEKRPAHVTPLESRTKRELMRKYIHERLHRPQPSKIVERVAKQLAAEETRTLKEPPRRTPPFQPPLDAKPTVEQKDVALQSAEPFEFELNYERQPNPRESVPRDLRSATLNWTSPKARSNAVHDSFASFYDGEEQYTEELPEVHEPAQPVLPPEPVQPMKSFEPLEFRYSPQDTYSPRLYDRPIIRHSEAWNLPRENLSEVPHRPAPIKDQCNNYSPEQLNNDNMLLDQIRTLRSENMHLKLQLQSLDDTRQHKKTPKRSIGRPATSRGALRPSASAKTVSDSTLARGRHCVHCAVLLSKGYSTAGCSHHGPKPESVNI